jgi:diguanylate cyclase (GGDEF)-like protein/PAS domain S-box-containing protein
MHRLLKRQIERLGLNPAAAPNVPLWKQFLDRINATYVQSDEARHLSERSMDLSSREMHELHERIRKSNEQLEERVRERTAELARAERSARDSEARFRSLTELSSDWYWEQDEDMRFIEVTGHNTSSAGEGAPHRYIGRTRWETGLEILGTTWEEHRKTLGARRPFRDQQFRRRHPDGSVTYIAVSGEPLYDAAGAFKGYRGVGRDITERKRDEELLALEHAVTRCLADAESASGAIKSVLHAVCETEHWECGRYFEPDADTHTLRFQEAWCVPVPVVERFVEETKILRFAPGVGLVGRAWQAGVPLWANDIATDPRTLKSSIALSSGMRGIFVVPVLAEGKTLGVLAFSSSKPREPEERLLQAMRVIGSQIGQFIQRKQAEEKVLHLAQFDTVTGLPNRYLFNDRLVVMLTQAQRNHWALGILFVDLDRFKAVNDTLGHAAGDLLLRLVAARLRECVRPSDIVGRLSGDEFALVLANLAKVDDAGLVAQKIVGALAAPFDLGGHQTYISASIGIALYPNDGGDAATLVRNADTAMYRAKEQGRNGYRFYLPEMNERLRQRLEREAQLRGALERDEYRLHYQPKVSLRTGAISGFEALLRWEHGGRLVPPVEFIPILEYTGLIVPVGEWVVRSVCQQIKRWEKQRLAVQPVAINLSARQFQRTNLVEAIGRIVRETGVAPGLLELELTETLLMSDAEEAVDTLRKLKALGARIAVDDFGTGYSSLAYLKRFPLDALKIDRTFVRDAVTDPDDAAITLSIINLAHSLKLNVVAEGVETEGQLQFLRTHGCDEMQGFYFSRPLPVEDSTRALAEGRRLQVEHAAPAGFGR